MKRLDTLIASLIAGAAVVLPFASVQTWTGAVSDSACGVKHTMANMADRECTQFCAKAGALYVLISGGKIYKLTNHAADLMAHAGHAVLVSGTLKGDTITVSKIEMPKG